MTKFFLNKNIFLIEYKHIYFLYKKLLNIKMYLPFCNLSATIYTSEKLFFYCFSVLSRQFSQILSRRIVFITSYICCIPGFSYKQFEEIKRLPRTIKL